ncbi:glycosyltransferase 87 family protein [Pilimelia columellifera]|uniref:Glycosyltransferase 87 family protein n=1 Tax=Pilimelia columellifera subsp. columellifera TaxID=706583 RepID=A0ABN3N0E4_9ACTN
MIRSGWWRRVDRAGGGLWADLSLYGAGAVFALVTAAASTLAPHQAWGRIAAPVYAVAAACVVVQLARRGPWSAPPARAALAALTWIGTTLVPLVAQAVQRSAGNPARAQEEVPVVEDGGRRLVETGTPYLSQDVIAGLPPVEWLVSYLPYQPGMALFGLPRAVAGDLWWSDARISFLLVTAIAVGAALWLLREAPATTLVRAGQAVAALPICALTLATGGDDLPVLGLCLLAMALLATGRVTAAGLAIGVAGSLKLLAAPVIVVLAVTVMARHRARLWRFLAGAVLLPAFVIVPALVVDAGALVDNVIRFPSGDGLVTSPARSPLPGHLIASAVPGGRALAVAALGVAAVSIAALLWRRPPRDAAQAAAVCAWGLLAAIVLMPATRFGYLLYPAVLALWVPALAGAACRVTPPGGRPASAALAR